MASGLNLQIVPGRYAIARLAPDAPLPDWADGPGFMAISRASDELTVICLEERIPEGVETDAGWFCLRTIGPFGFGEAGIVHRLITPLSENGIGIFVVCTFDGEHLLLAEADRERAIALLGTAGHRFV